MSSLERGAAVGRYVVLSKLGAGGMGVVLAAYDPELDRKVALKLLRFRSHDGGKARVRLQREAQALARLNHPNVVGVHDVGVHEGQVFVAMEFVEGQMLGAWMRSGPRGQPRPWAEVVKIMAAAGRGLAAAHEQGLIHRDFKPDNVMIGVDGRVRVMDFGLSWSGSGSGAGTGSGTHPRPHVSDSTDELERSLRRPLDVRLTRAGALLGTPAYMAPEQFHGVEVTAQADQFGFCVVLHEALFGVRPFEGETMVELAHAVTQGRLREPLPGIDMPGWLKKVVRRGLSVIPSQRFGSMPELLASLGRGAGLRRRKRWFMTGGALALALAGVFGVQHYDRVQRTNRCIAQGDAIVEVWNPSTREAVRAGFIATGANNSAIMADKVVPWIDEHAESWRTNTTAACMNATVHRIWDEPTFNKARSCLDQRRIHLSTLVAEFPKTDAHGIQNTVEIAATLRVADSCVDETSLAGMSEPPPKALRAEITDIREVLAVARHLLSTGQHLEGLEMVRDAKERAEVLSWPPLMADVLLMESILLDRSGALAEAEVAAVESYMMATRSGHWGVAAGAASHLVFVIGREQARLSEGRVWAKHAEVAIAYTGDPNGLREASRLNNLGTIHYSAGDYEQAMALCERVLAINEEVLGPNHPEVAKSLNNLGVLLEANGKYAEAVMLHRRALTIRKTVLGSGHPRVAKSLANLGNAHLGQGHPEEAKALYTRALRILEDTIGPDHPDLAILLSNLGAVLQKLKEYEESRLLQERALRIYRKTLAPDHPNIASSMTNLAHVLSWEGDHERARALYEDAVRIRERALGPEDPKLASPLVGLGELLVELGHGREGLEHLERAAAVQSAASEIHSVPAKTRFAQAEALWDVPPSEGGDRTRARRLVQQIIDDHAHTGVGLEEVARAEEWLHEHPE